MPNSSLLNGASRRMTGLSIAAGVLLVVCVLSLAVGAKPIAAGTVMQAVTDFDGSPDHLVVRELRLPRTLIGLLVGAALGAAGALMQAMTRNPLADPGLLGVSAGASLAVVLAIWLFGFSSVLALVWFALAGSALASAAVYALGSVGRSGAASVRLALAGVAMAALLTALTWAVLLLDQAALDQFRFWNVGSLAGRDTTVLAQIAPFIVAGLAVGLACARSLNAIGLGDDAARALGIRVGWTRAATALAVTLLCGAATAACGPIGFVGLVVPLAARVVTGPDQRWLLPYAAVVGAVVLLGCDIVGRVIDRPSEVQVGIVTAGIGGPVFVMLVRRVKMAQL